MQEVEAGPASRKTIGVDQPFDYEEVVRVTGPGYARNLDSTGFSFQPYAEVKRNAALLLDDQCIWTKSGLIEYRVCDNAYDCSKCGFDKAMRKKYALGTPASKEARPKWAEELQKRYPGPERPCRHYLSGRIEGPKICPMNYECYHCPFDQMLDEVDLAEPPASAGRIMVNGFHVEEGYHYHSGHCWAQFEQGGWIRVGFDDFLARVFGEFHFLDLPRLGASLEQNGVGFKFGRDRKTAEVLSPASGKIVTINHKVIKDPSIAHDAPYDQGWLFILEPSRAKGNLKKLFHGEACLRWMDEESRKLAGLMGQEYEKLAATGGEMIKDLYGHFPEIGWETLTKNFLGTKGE
jgi:glycine cleavage system H lipoate-binding protein